MNRLKLWTSVVWVLSYGTPFFAFAQVFTGPVASGTGGAGVASVEVVESIFLNPASLSQAPDFSAGVFYQNGWREGLVRESQLVLNIVDNSEDVLVPGGLSYLQSTIRPFGGAEGSKKVWSLTLGGFVMPTLSFGATLQHSSFSLPNMEETDLNANLGVLWNPHPDWGFGLVVYNVAGENQDIVKDYRDLQKVAAGLTFVASEYLRVRADVSQRLKDNENKDLQLLGGFESQLNQFFILRVGWSHDQLIKRDNLTAGFSLVTPRFNLDYAIQDSQSDNSQGALHSVDLAITF